MSPLVDAAHYALALDCRWIEYHVDGRVWEYVAGKLLQDLDKCKPCAFATC